MLERWIIDGYNVWRQAPKTSSRSESIAKDQFLSRIASFAAKTNRFVWVIFDGIGSDEEFRSFRTRQLEIRYSQKVNADTWIERYLCQNKEFKGLTYVATNDRAIGQLAQGFGARVRGAEEFWKQLASSEAEARRTLSESDIDKRGFHRPFDTKLDNLKKPKNSNS